MLPRPHVCQAIKSFRPFNGSLWILCGLVTFAMSILVYFLAPPPTEPERHDWRGYLLPPHRRSTTPSVPQRTRWDKLDVGARDALTGMGMGVYESLMQLLTGFEARQTPSVPLRIAYVGWAFFITLTLVCRARTCGNESAI
jgi:hypothetical protein